MAEKKAEKPAAPKKTAAAKAPAAAKAASADAAPKAVKAKAPRGAVSARSKATPAAPEGQRCSVDKCSQPVRAKGMCRKHYIGWRRGDVGAAHRYKVCSKEGCRNPRTHGGLCDEHSGKAVPAAEGAAAAPAPAAG
jgi:hypothetical protein